MVALTSEEKQVVALFQKLPPDRRAYVMLAMAASDPDAWKRYQPEGEERLRQLAGERGLNWDAMDDDQRQDLVSELLREDRP